jgi:hypothetical protein
MTTVKVMFWNDSLNNINNLITDFPVYIVYLDAYFIYIYSSICTSKHSQPVPLLFTVSCLYQLSIHHIIELILLQEAYRCGMNTVNYFLISLHFCTKLYFFFTNLKQCYLYSVQSFFYFIPFLFHIWNGYSVTEAGYIVTVKECWNWVMSCLSEAII